MKKLVIISHTPHYLSTSGEIAGWGPTVNELNYLSTFVDSIIHVAPLHKETAPPSSHVYANSNITFVAIPTSGGETFLSKVDVLFKMFGIIGTISKQLTDATYVQLRVPTGIAVFLLPYFAFWRKRTFTLWVKYAGNWDEQKPPLGYRFQRWFLTQNFARCAVTINGKWPNQRKHMVSMENPCLTQTDIETATSITKDFEVEQYTICFVGALIDTKGIPEIIEMLNDHDIRKKIARFYFVGDGPKRDLYKNQVTDLTNIEFLGFKDKEGVHDILKQSHFILLPSQSEGFPKAIAEAACYGCIPVVSDVSCIGQYINEKNGYLWNKQQPFKQLVKQALYTDPIQLKRKSNSLTTMRQLFTFEHFKNNIMRILTIETT